MSDVLSYVLIGIPAWLAGITIIVFVHELGHFLVGRLFGVSIETFSIGFGGEVVGWTDRRGTRWKISWIPFGGYVKFLGDADASSKPDLEALKNLPVAARANALHLKPLWQRALVVAAGPVANFILAIVIFAGLNFAQEQPLAPPTVAEVLKGTPAERAGFKPGDVIESVNGQSVDEFENFRQTVIVGAGQPFHVGIRRNGQPMTIDVTAARQQVTLIDGSKQIIGQLGLAPKIGPVSLGRAVRLAALQTWDIATGTLGYIGKMFTGAQGTSDLRGPVGIADLYTHVAKTGIVPLLGLAALISVSIGLLNLFPIPVLDGGHLLYYGCEAVLGRPLGEKAQEVGFRLGLALVLALMLLATFNDLVRLNLF